MAEQVPRDEEMLRRIIHNQRMILEQNEKLLQQQRQSIDEERERGLLRHDKIPLELKVCPYFFLYFNFDMNRNKHQLKAGKTRFFTHMKYLVINMNTMYKNI